MHEHDHADVLREECHGHQRPRHHGRIRHGRDGHHGHDRRGFDPSRFEGRGLNREALLAKLERYQRDLEERTADVADMIRRLTAETSATTSPTDPVSTA